jgi:hypothetical protein
LTLAWPCPSMRGRCSSIVNLVAARRYSFNASAGVFQLRVLRGRLLSAAATASRSAALCLIRSVPLGKYWRSSPLVFSLVLAGGRDAHSPTRLLADDDPARVLAARQALRRVADTDVPRVAAAAQTLLDTPPTQPSPHHGTRDTETETPAPGPAYRWRRLWPFGRAPRSRTAQRAEGATPVGGPSRLAGECGRGDVAWSMLPRLRWSSRPPARRPRC